MDRSTPGGILQTKGSSEFLDYPRQSDTFVLTTDSSEHGLGAVLSTSRGTVVEYASRAFTAAEKKYCTSEQECLAIVWATRKLRHYLIGACFTLETDHKPLEWLESARKSHARAQRLEHWSLELRAFEFDIVHRPGKFNQHADALSRIPVAVVGVNSSISMSTLAKAQLNDPVLSEVHHQLSTNCPPPATGSWTKIPLKRYRQLWSQLLLQDSVICRKIKSPSMSDTKLLIVVPHSLQKAFLTIAHEDSGTRVSIAPYQDFQSWHTGWEWGKRLCAIARTATSAKCRKHPHLSRPPCNP